MLDSSGLARQGAKSSPVRARAIAQKRRIEIHPDLRPASRRFGIALLDRLWVRTRDPRPTHRLSMGVIGERLGVSESTAKRHIKALEAAKVLEAVAWRYGGRGRVPIWTLCDPLELSTRGAERVSKTPERVSIAAMVTRDFATQRVSICTPPPKGSLTETPLDENAIASIASIADLTPPDRVPERVAELRLALAGPGVDR